LIASAVLAFLSMSSALASSPAQPDSRTSWFEAARFGLFIHWNADAASWKFYVPSAGTRTVTVSYACTTAVAGQQFEVSAGPGLQATAKTEATQANWSEFRPFKIASFNFPTPGYYTITVKPSGPVKDELFKLLWLHIGS
jgi:hypothetical protein